MDWRADFDCRPMEAQHTEGYLGGISLVCARSCACVAMWAAVMVRLCRELASRGYEVVGCEPSAESLHFAQLGAPGLVFHRLAVDDDPPAIGNESFDVAIATEVIEHLVRPFNLPRRSPDHQPPRITAT